MSTQKNLITLCIATVFTLGLAACGGGGGGDAPVTGMMDDDTTMDESPMIAGQTVPSGTTITLPAGFELQDGTLRANMDQTITVEGFGTFTCVNADGCSVDLTDGVITTNGDITVVSLDVTDADILAQLAAVFPPEPVELTELETAQADAAAAATAAMTAAGNAATSATEATEAVANLATVQTGETSRGLATKAGEQAALAHAAYMTAKTAADAAEAATDVTAGVRAQVNAEDALADATAAETMAGNYGQMAVDAAGNELIIEGTVKTVGGTSLDATAGTSVMVTGEGADAQTVRTGLIKSMNPMTTGPGVPVVDAAEFMEAIPAATADDDAVVGVAHKQAVAPRPLTIGKVVDSADDMARLMIVTQYDGTKSVKVYAENETAAALEGQLGSDGRIQTMGVEMAGVPNTPSGDDVFVTLKSVGTYYLGSGGSDRNVLEAADVVGAKAAAKKVFSYGVGEDTVYVVLSRTTIGDATEVIYQVVDITVVGPMVDDAATVMEVNASIPEATDYRHIHFGAWAALGDAKKDGMQAPADLGIGFVQSIGDGMTGADMPNNGTATYDGSWVAAVRAEDAEGNGDISLVSGDAGLAANFDKDEITANLMGLATLSGDISGNTFSGTKATVMDSDPHGLDSGGKFTGSFGGGFYGTKAAEAGGVFDFTSKDATRTVRSAVPLVVPGKF